MTISQDLNQLIHEFIHLLRRITEMEQPEFDHQYHTRLNRIDSLCSPESREYWMSRFFELSADILNNGYMHQRTRNKPLGYAGDYQVIDWMYSLKTAQDEPGKHLDWLFHRQAASQAVRHRKEYFCDLFMKSSSGSEYGIAVLNLASGPCSEIADAIMQTGPKANGSFIHCVDMEPEAMTYAEEVIKPLSERHASFTMQVTNVFRLKTTRQYDLVWCAGLFDYLNDKLAVNLLRKMFGWTRDGGRLVVGNFHPDNPTRISMEWCLSWFLLHRAEKDFIRLCDLAGIPPECLSFERDPLGAIIYCTVAKNSA